jgi:hypothetical protein
MTAGVSGTHSTVPTRYGALDVSRSSSRNRCSPVVMMSKRPSGSCVAWRNSAVHPIV